MHPDDESFGRRLIHYADAGIMFLLALIAVVLIIFCTQIGGFGDEIRQRGPLPTVQPTAYVPKPVTERCYPDPMVTQTTEICREVKP